MDNSTGLNYNPQVHDPVLRRVLHGGSGAEALWERLRQRGLTDDELTEVISYRFGIFGGSSGPGRIPETHAGGKKPRFWVGTSGGQGKPSLTGIELLNAARRVLRLFKPDDDTLGLVRSVEASSIKAKPKGEPEHAQVATFDRNRHYRNDSVRVTSQLGLFE